MMLRDQSIALPWNVRLTFACDIAHGMAYLHARGMLHRDLKADNCFVDNKMLRVKVADFGTGHIGARMAKGHEADQPPRRGSVSVVNRYPSVSGVRSRVVNRNRHESLTMSIGGGSLMWMSPERLREQRVTRAEAEAGDVFRYTCRLFNAKLSISR